MAKKRSSSTSSKKKKKSTTSKSRPIFSSPLTKAVQDAKNKGKEEEQQEPMNDVNSPTIEKDNEEELPKTKKYKKNHTTTPNKYKQRQQEQEAKDNEEEERLTSLLFGDAFATTADAGDDEDRMYDNDDENDEDLNEDGSSAWKDDDEEDHDNSGGGVLFEIDRKATPLSKKKIVQNDTDDDDDEEEEEDIPTKHDPIQSDDDDNDSESNEEEATGGAAAWVDDDDDDVQINFNNKATKKSSHTSSDRIQKLKRTQGEQSIQGPEYQERLRERFQLTSNLTARTDWAAVNDGDDDDDSRTGMDDSDDEEEGVSSANKLLSSTVPLLSSTSTSSYKLPPNILNVVRCPDANITNYSQSSIQSVQFHPGCDDGEDGEPLLLTAGMDKTLRFFKIEEGGAKSTKVHGIHFPKFPIRKAAFLGDTGNVVVSGRKPFYYIYDAVAGKVDKIPRILGGRQDKSLESFETSPDGQIIAFLCNDGYISLVEARTKAWITDLKLNGSVRAVTFTGGDDGSDYLLASGSDGEVYKWDMRTYRCVDKFTNQDGTITSSLSASSQIMAVGAESGVVNLYHNQLRDISKVSSFSSDFATPTPLKSIMNLQTAIDNLSFNHDGQILALSTKREKDSLKLLHVPTRTVFSNWPTSKTPLGYVWSSDFSPESRFLALGNDKGKCLLYKLNHYHSDG